MVLCLCPWHRRPDRRVRRQLAEADRSLADLLPAVPDEERGRWSDLVLLVAILATLRAFWRMDRLAGLLLLPYAAWVAFATMLNWTICRLNSPFMAMQ